MALKPCPECKKDISTLAKMCPHCGTKKPFESAVLRGMNSAANAMMGLGCLVLLLVFLFLIIGSWFGS